MNMNIQFIDIGEYRYPMSFSLACVSQMGNFTQAAKKIEEGQDYCTLITCTPYGVNSHRLLVRGTRVPYNGEEEVTGSVADTMLHAIQNYYMLYLLLGIAITVLIIVIMKVASGRKQRNT